MQVFEGIIFDQPLNPNRIVSICDQRDFELIIEQELIRNIDIFQFDSIDRSTLLCVYFALVVSCRKGAKMA